MNPQLKTITFDTGRIIKSIHHISKVSNTATAIFHATRNYDVDEITSLETDGLGFVFTDENGKSKVDSQMIDDWVFKKAFEDFIIGLTQSLIEIYTFIEIVKVALLSQTTPIDPDTTIEELQAAIFKKVNKLSFPALLEDIETRLGGSVAYKSEILTINQVRNCLVHRNGIVDEAKPITLRYVDTLMYVKIDGEMVEVTKEFKRNRTLVQGLEASSSNRELKFDGGTKIALTPDIFKGVTNTCILFVRELVKKLPFDESIKRNLVPPYLINLAIEDTI